MKASIPVRISPMFWLTAALIGWLSSWNLMGTLIWIGIIFVSILVHEYGHALTSRFFGQFPRIELMAFGGLTYPEGPRIQPMKEFIVVLNGPLFSLGLYGIGTLLLSVETVKASSAASVLEAFRTINLFWTVINLLPVLPLDGGQLLRVALEGFFGVKGLKLSMLIGVILAFSLAIVALFFGWFLIGAIFFLFGFQNIQTWKITKPVAQVDKNEDYHKQLIEAEEFIFKREDHKAASILEDLRKKTKTGVLFITATQHLARIKFEEGNSAETYHLLLSIKDNLSEDFKALMHIVAFENKDYGFVREIGNSCFLRDPSPYVALRNAIAAAFFVRVEETIGWLEAALREGVEDLSKVLTDHVFDNVKKDQSFQDFLKTHLIDKEKGF